MPSRTRISSGFRGWAASLLLLAAAGAAPAAGPASSWWARLGERDLSGRPLQAAGRAYVIVFLGQECPVSNAAIPVLNRLAAEYGPQGFVFIGAYVDPTADLAALRDHAAAYQLGLRAADDRAHRLVQLAGAEYTPEAAVFSAEGRRLYLGRIDDRVGSPAAARPAATRQDLRDVLRALAAGQPGPFAGIAGYGCAIPEAVRP